MNIYRNIHCILSDTILPQLFPHWTSTYFTSKLLQQQPFCRRYVWNYRWIPTGMYTVSFQTQYCPNYSLTGQAPTLPASSFNSSLSAGGASGTTYEHLQECTLYPFRHNIAPIIPSLDKHLLYQQAPSAAAFLQEVRLELHMNIYRNIHCILSGTILPQLFPHWTSTYFTSKLLQQQPFCRRYVWNYRWIPTGMYTVSFQTQYSSNYSLT